MKTKKEKNLMSNKKIHSYLTGKAASFIFMTLFFSLMFCMLVYAADPAPAADSALTSAQGLLSKAAIAGGGLWAVWGLVQLGMSIKDHNGPGIGGAVWQIVGGAVIIAAGGLIGNVDLNMDTTTAAIEQTVNYYIC